MEAELTNIGGTCYWTVFYMGDELVFDTQEEAENFIKEMEN